MPHTIHNHAHSTHRKIRAAKSKDLSLRSELLEPRICLSAWGVALIDQNIANASLFAQAANNNLHVIEYDSQKETPASLLQQVTLWAAQVGHQIDQLAIVSHGNVGVFQFGNTQVSNDYFDSKPWVQFQSTLAPNAQIAIFGCNTAQGTRGQELLNDIAQATGATVFGSNNITGISGDWNLEVSSSNYLKTIPNIAGTWFNPILLQQYQGNLSLPVFSDFSSLANLSINQSGSYTPTTNGTALRLLNNTTAEATSVWWNQQLDVTKFQTNFSFLVSGDSQADGFTFTLQGDSSSALGGTGSNLGAAGINNAVSLAFNIFTSGSYGSELGLKINGVGDTTAVGGGLDFHAGHTINAQLTYDGTDLIVTLIDATNPALRTTITYNNVDIPTLVGGSTAYAGFTAATGGETCNIDIASWSFANSTQLIGAILGTDGSWDGYSTKDKAFDGNLNTYVDLTSSQGWVGLDFTQPVVINGIKFAPRDTLASRMVGGYFEVSNNSDFSSATTIYTISSQPADGTLTSVDLSVSGTWRYLRYVCPSGGWGNVAEIQAWGLSSAVVPIPPSNLTITATSFNSVDLSWTDNSNDEAGFIIERATDSGFTTGLTTVTTTSSNTTTYTDTTVASGTTYYYRVRSYNYAGNSLPCSSAHTTTITVAQLSGLIIGTSGSVDGTSTIDKAFDGDLNTYVDNSTSNAWMGLDLGGQGTIASIKFAPRTGLASRMVNGYFEVSNNADFSSATTIYTITSTPTEGSLTTINVSVSGTWRYLRYVSPNNSWGNVAEIEFWGVAPLIPPFAPSNLHITNNANNQIDLAWTDNASTETAFELQRATDSAFTTNLTTYSLAANTSTYSDTGLAAGTTYYYRVRATNAYGDSSYTSYHYSTVWNQTDIGAVGFTGSMVNDNGSYTLIGSGTDMWDAYDEFSYNYLSLHGDGAMVVRINSIQNTDNWAKAGIMIRENVSGLNATSSKYVDMVFTPSGYAQLQYRSITGDTTDEQSLHSLSTPQWLRLTRVGDTFFGAISSDSTTWTQVGSITVNMATDVYLGLAVCSHNNSVTNTVTFDNVSIASSLAAAPTNLTATTPFAATITLNWTDNSSDETGFIIERATDSNFTQNLTTVTTTTANTTTYTDTGLSTNQTYYYRIKAVNFYGPGVYANSASATTLVGSTSPTIIAYNNHLSLYWTAPNSPCDGYNVYRSTSLSGAYTKLNLSGLVTALTYNDSTITPGVTYYYLVAAVNSSVEGTLSAPVPGAIPLSHCVQITTDSTTLGSWKGTYGSQGYIIYGDSSSLPSWANISLSGSYANYDYPQTTSNSGDLEKANSSDHIYSPLYSTSTFTVDLEFTDGLTHQVAFYLQPGHPNGMDDLIRVLDATTSQVLNIQEFASEDVTRGIYMLFNISGHVHVEFHDQYSLANLSGIFIDPPANPTQTQFYDPLTDLNSTDQTHSTNNWALNNNPNDAWQYHMDGSRVNMSAYGDASLAWHIPGATAFHAVVSFPVSDFDAATTTFTLSTSSDGNSWIDLPLTIDSSLLLDSLSTRTLFTLSNTALPTGTAYLRLNATTGGRQDLWWTINIHSVSIEHYIAASPTIITPVSTTATDVYNTTADLHVTADDDAGESNLTYTWTTANDDPGTVTFSDNGTNSAKDTTAHFSAIGTYHLRVTVTNGNGMIAYSTIVVNYHLAPSVPSQLVVTPASDTTINLAWTDNSYDEASFVLQRATDASFTQNLTSTTLSANTTTYSETSLSPNTHYYYRIKAVNPAGSSSWSTAASATTYSILPGSWTLNNIATPQTGTSWYDPTTGTYYLNGSGDIDGTWGTDDSFSYVYQSYTSGNMQIVAHLAAPLNNTQYFAQAGIMIRDISNGASDPSAPYAGIFFDYNGLIQSQCRGAYGMNFVAQYDNSSMQYSWLKLVRTDDTFNFYMSADGTNWISEGPATPITMGSNLAVGLVATSRNINSLLNTTMDHVQVTVNPATPTNLATDSVGETQAHITWTDNANDETSYVLERATNANFTSGQTSFTLAANTTSYTDTGLTADTAYYYRVKALNSTGDSAHSTVEDIRTLVHPVAPTVTPTLSVVTTSSEIALSWTAPNGGPFTGYNIYRSTTLNGIYTKLNTSGLISGTSYQDASVLNGVTYYYKITVSNAVGEGPRSSALSATAINAHATFVAFDTSTQGSWKTVYGSNGYQILGDSTNLPTWAQIQFSGTYTQSTPQFTTNAGDLQRAGSSSSHVFSPWWSTGNFALDLDFTDGLSHQIAFYVQPATSDGVHDIFQIVDAASNQVLNVQEYSSNDTSRGTYIIFNITGHVRLNLLCNGYSSGINGIFLDPASAIATTRFDDPLADLSLTDASRSTSNWTTASETYDLVDSDASRITPTNTNPATLTWHIANASTFAARFSYHSSLISDPSQYIHLYTSADGTTWTEISYLTFTPTPNSGDWVSQTLSNASALPAGTNYVRLTMVSPSVGALELNRIVSTLACAPTPTITQAVSADTSTSYTQPINLSVRASDPNGNSNLTYSWSAIGASPADVSFTNNGTNNAQDTTATFTTSGVYTLQVKVFNASGLYATSTVTVTYYATPIPPSNLQGQTLSTSSISLVWNDHSSMETGFVIQRATNLTFTSNLTSFTVAANTTSFTDTGLVGNTTYYYRVQAINTNGGSNFTNVVSSTTLPSTTVPVISPTARFTTVPGQIVLSWDTPIGGPYTGYNVYRASTLNGSYQLLNPSALITGNSYTDATAVAGTTYYYKLAVVNQYGEGPLGSAQAQRCASAAATFVTMDTTTIGNWKGNYGSQGYIIFGDQTSLPSWAQISMTGFYNNYPTPSTTTDSGDLQKAASSTDRIHSPLWSFVTFGLDINFTDGQTHQVALYCEAGHPNGMTNLFKLYDALTGEVLEIQDLHSWDTTQGTYVVFNVTGHVLLDIENEGYNNNLSGVFIDPKANPTSTVFFDPLNDLSRVDPTLTSSSWSIDTVLGWVYMGNSGRAVSVSNTTQSIVWHVPSSTQFSAQIFHQDAVDSLFSSMYQFYYSSDGVNWTPATLSISDTGLIFGVLHYGTFTSSTLPAGTSYLRLDVTASTSTDLEIGGVSITHDLAATPTIVSPATASPTDAWGTTVDLSTLARDDAGEANLIYNWSVISGNSSNVSFLHNGNNEAKNTSVTFTTTGTYTLRVSVTNPNGLMTYSNITINYHALPASPSSLLATAVSANQINLSWTRNSSDENGFIILRATDANFTQNLLLTTVSAGITGFVDTGLSSNTNYFYRVYAINHTGTSPSSNISSALTEKVITTNLISSDITQTISNSTTPVDPFANPMMLPPFGPHGPHDPPPHDAPPQHDSFDRSRADMPPVVLLASSSGTGTTGGAISLKNSNSGPNAPTLNTNREITPSHNDSHDSGTSKGAVSNPTVTTPLSIPVSSGVGSTDNTSAPNSKDVAAAIRGETTTSDLNRIVQAAQVDKVISQLRAAQANVTSQADSVATHIATLSRPTKIVLGVTSTVTAAGSTLYIIWIARGGSVLASLLTAAPVWRFLDPLPVLDRAKAKSISRKRRHKKLTTLGDSDDTDRDLEALVD